MMAPLTQQMLLIFTSSDVLWCNAWLLLEYTQRKNNNKETGEDYSL